MSILPGYEFEVTKSNKKLTKYPPKMVELYCTTRMNFYMFSVDILFKCIKTEVF